MSVGAALCFTVLPTTNSSANPAWNTGRLSGGYGNRDFDHTSLGLDKNLIQQFPTGGWFGRHEWTNYEGLRS